MMPEECRALREKMDDLDRVDGYEPAESGTPLQRHLGVCEECREFVQLLQAARTEVQRAEPDPFLIRRVKVAVTTDHPPVRKTGPFGRWQLWALPAAAVAGAVAIVLWLGTPDSSDLMIRRSPVYQLARSDAPNPSGVDWPTISTTPDGRRYIEVFSGTYFWLSDQAQIRVRQLNDKLAHFHLDQGVAVAQIGPHGPGFRFIVELTHGMVEAKGTVFSTEVDGDREIVRVLTGVVEVTTRDHPDGVTVAAGNAMRIHGRDADVELSLQLAQDRCLFERCDSAVDPAAESDRRRSAPRAGQSPSAAELVELATAHRREKRFKRAAKVYRRLIKAYPRSDAALNARVALGQIELDVLGRASDALKRFNTYLALAPTGPLAKTCRVYRIYALGRTGRHTEVLRAADGFLKAYPSGAYRREILYHKGVAQARLGNCPKAVRLFQQIISRWPESRAARRSGRELSACGEQ